MRAKAFVAAGLLGISVNAGAGGFPVFDGANLSSAVQQFVQLQKQYSNMQQQLTTAEDQLSNARSRLRAMTNRNSFSGMGEGKYFTGWEDLNGEDLAEEYGLTQETPESYSEQTRESMRTDSRRLGRQMESVQRMLSNAKDRYAKIQTMINRIDESPDTKTTADLQARIAGEQAKLMNDMLKVTLLKKRWDMRQRQASVQREKAGMSSLLDE